MTEDTRKIIEQKLRGAQYCINASRDAAKLGGDTDAAKDLRLGIHTLIEVVQELLSYIE